jgi:predicted AAA+ superfamily ATPase
MIIKRKLEKYVKESAKDYPVLFITGPRQSGKTTLVKQVFKNYFYSNLEDPEIRLMAKNDPKTFLFQAETMIIDEVQRVPELLSYIQAIIDKEEKKKFIISGSQNLLISQKISQSLAGRVNILNLLPFSLEEIRETAYGKKELFEQIFYGFYPRIYDKNLRPENWYNNYVQTYLERDVREIKNIGNLLDFHRFLKLCAGRTGQILNLSSLSNELGISVNTVKEWLSILEATFIIRVLPPYYKNFNKRIIKSPKIYFYDTGLVCSLLSIRDFTYLETHPLFGNIYETFCIADIVKQSFNNNVNLDFYYWRDKIGNEIDLLYEKNNFINAVEMKSSQTFTEEFTKRLDYFEKIAQRKIKKKIILNIKEKRKYKDIILQGWDFNTI